MEKFRHKDWRRAERHVVACCRALAWKSFRRTEGNLEKFCGVRSSMHNKVKYVLLYRQHTPHKWGFDDRTMAVYPLCLVWRK